jgi:hypothetical protein
MGLAMGSPLEEAVEVKREFTTTRVKSVDGLRRDSRG